MLTFEPDELQAVVDAAAAVRELGDPLLATEAAHALRKLAVDLPLDGAAASADAPRVVLPRSRPDADVFDALGDALARRKTVRFAYHAMSTDQHGERDAEPYGLFFLNGHWYLAARDRTRGELRNFRLDRVGEVRVNTAKSQSADYAVPATFHLRVHARSRQAWELGDADAARAVVEFRGASGPTRAAARLGEAIDGDDEVSDTGRERRAFAVRRMEPFVRWLLSFAGEVVPVEPAALVSRYTEEARRVAALYDDAVGARDDEKSHLAAIESPPMARSTAGGPRVVRAPVPVDAWQPATAAAQLRRILHVVPQIADGEEHPIGEVAARIGTDERTLRRDLFSLVTRFDEPAGFVEGVAVYLESETVSAFSNHLLRPMRLTAPELCALELGLAVLRARRPPDEEPVIDRARARLGAVLAQLPDDPIPSGLREVMLADHGSDAHLAAVSGAARAGRKVRLVYRKSGGDGATARIVCPYALVAASGMLYVVAWCEDGDGVRVFRMDRVEDATALDATFVRDAAFSLDAVLADGRVFHNPTAGTMRVRYSPRVARWIAEREGQPLDADGGLELEHPLGDPEWGLRHVLQYGAEAEVVEPPALREELRRRAMRMAGDEW